MSPEAISPALTSSPYVVGIILVELSFFVSPGTKFVTKRDIAWLLALVNSEDIDEGVLLGVLKLIGGLCETNYGKARYRTTRFRNRELCFD
jgi:hypothetical protein